MAMKTAQVQIRLDKNGMGEIVLNGVHIESVVQALRVTSIVGEGMTLHLDILAGSMDVEASEIAVTLRELQPKTPEPLKHTMVEIQGRFMCTTCRRFEDNPRFPAACPGVPKWAQKGTQS